ncbi:MAG: PxKF domain-containing protein, partial [Deinococcota bacterium]|nr:PxKF domain-containing protein [Deinococcota bacterium]
YNAAHQIFDITVNPWAFGGWQQPLVSLPTRNTVKAGRAIPVRFSLGADYGLNIFNGSGPGTASASCTAAATDPVEETLTAGSSSLSYDATTGMYTYVWKTEASWAGKCRTFNLNLKDGSTHSVTFQLLK